MARLLKRHNSGEKTRGGSAVLLFPRVTEALPPVHSLPRGPQAFGVEALYALQEVDPRSVRRLTPPKPHDPQFYLPFAEKGHGTMPSLRLSEPIQVLELSRASERVLLNLGKRTVGEVHALLLDSEAVPEGMSHWVWDEARERIEAYLAGLEDPFAVEWVDFLALLRTVLGDLDRVSVHLFLKPFELEELLPLGQVERVRLRKMGPHERRRRSEQVTRRLLRIERQRMLWSSLHRVVEEFIHPWMAKRGGIASSRALLDRLRAVSEDRLQAKRVVRLLTKLYAGSKDFWALLLHEVDHRVYSALPEVAHQYELVLSCAHHYFYHRTVVYPLAHIVELVSCEIARKWEGFKEGFIERVIRGSSTFELTKGRVRLADN